MEASLPLACCQPAPAAPRPQFLGDFVDRGAHSLETICLLLALKIEHPRSVHLIRGNHEASDINALFGFRLECLERLGDQQGLKAWQRLNTLFNWLPLAALIEDKVQIAACWRVVLLTCSAVQTGSKPGILVGRLIKSVPH
jgi:hypothetical protein